MEKSSEINDVNLHSIQIAKLTSNYAITRKNYENLLKTKHSRKELEAKRMHQLDTFRNICMNQEKIISDLHEYKEKNDLLQKENVALAKLNHTLKQKIADGTRSRAQSLHEQIAINKQKLEEHDRQAELRVRQLDQQLQSVQATSDARITDLREKIVTLVREFEAKLKTASNTECQLKSQVDKLDKHLSLTIAVYQKKLRASEQKVAALEKERALYPSTQTGFATAQNLLDTQQASHSDNRDLRTWGHVHSYISKHYEHVSNVVISGDTRFKPFTLRVQQRTDILANAVANRESNRNASRQTRPLRPCHSQTQPSDLDRGNKHGMPNSENDNNRNTSANAANNDITLAQHIRPIKRTRLYNPNR